ncbi:hypothetical protein [Gluconobacter sp. DsW_058]|nr:hypothetical protein [Gluconobacter sp. DsW_058]
MAAIAYPSRIKDRHSVPEAVMDRLPSSYPKEESNRHYVSP